VTANAPGSGTPTGTVTFYRGSTSLGTVADNGNAVSFTTLSPLPVGNDSIKASYSGDNTNYKSSTGTLTQAVNQDTTITSVVSTANPSVSGQSVTFTATVTANSPGSGVPTGAVTFMDGTTTLRKVALSGGTASYSTAKLSTGSHAITAVYGGDASFASNTAIVLTQTVNGTASAIAASSVTAAVDEVLGTLQNDSPAASPVADLPLDLTIPKLRRRVEAVAQKPRGPA
jgi:hypothetical protein